MKKTPGSIGRDARSGRFVLTRSKGEKISAVEGMTLSKRMDRVLRETREKGMTGDERRSRIKELAARKS